MKSIINFSRLFNVALCARLPRVVASCLILALGFVGFGSLAGSGLQISLGLEWLQSQVASSGQLAKPSVVGHDAQTQCEIANTLLQLVGSNPRTAALLSVLEASSPEISPTETLACTDVLRSRLGQVSATADALAARRTADGSLGAYASFIQGSLLDTAWALETQLARLDVAQRTQVFEWLKSRQQADGSFLINGAASLHTTAIVLRGLRKETERNSTAAALAKAAAAYLLSQRSVQGSWADDVVLTSVVYEAVHPYSGAQTDLGPLVATYLKSRQQPDGSWQSDPYVTAVALRALALTDAAPVDPTQAYLSTVVKGQINAVDTGAGLSGVQLSVFSSEGLIASAISDGQGGYSLSAPSSGSVTLQASISGYQTVTAVANLTPQGMVLFSPALSLVGAVMPTGAKIWGKVVNVDTTQVLAGVGISAQSGGGVVTGSTDGQGLFVLNLPGGATTVTYALSGYASATQQMVLSDGTQLNVGVVSMKPVAAQSNFRGQVLNTSGQTLAGARITELNSGASAVSNLAGGYSLGLVAGLQMNFRVSATGYDTRSYVIGLTNPADYVQDFTLSPTRSTSGSGSTTGTTTGSPGVSGVLEISAIQLSQKTVSANADATATVVISNPSSNTASAVLLLDVLDGQGTRVSRNGSFDLLTGQALSTVTLAPGQSRNALLKWNSGTFAAGNYSYTARLLVTNSLSSTNPQGTVMDSRADSLTVTPSPAFSGALTANPPVLQVGAGTKVSLSALIQNTGNTPLAAQPYVLSVIDAATGATTWTASVTAAQLPVGQLLPLVFDSWSPTAGGNFRLELVAPSTPGYKVTTTVYVGDAARANFTVTPQQVPLGSQKVRASIQVTGQDVASGSIGDPLAPLVKQAVTKAVNYADNYASTHYLNDLRCYACHVQTQAIVGGERNRRFALPINTLNRSILIDGIVKYIGLRGNILHDGGDYYPNVNSTLGLWALGEVYDSDDVKLSRKRISEFLIGNQNADGAWYSDHEAVWWRTAEPLTGLNIGSLAAYRKFISTHGSPRAPVLVKRNIPNLPNGKMRLTGLPDGGFIVANMSRNEVWQVTPDNMATMLISSADGIGVTNARPLPDGRMVVSGHAGVYIWSASDGLRKIASIDSWDALPYGLDRYLVSQSGGNTSYLVSASGDVRNFYYSDLMEGSMGTQVILPDGNILVNSYAGRRSVRFSPSGQFIDVPIPLMNGNPIEAVVIGGRVYMGMATGGLYSFSENWISEKLLINDAVYGIAKLTNGSLVLGANDAIYELVMPSDDTQEFAARLDGAVRKAGDWLVNAGGTSNNINMAFRLMGLAKYRDYLKEAGEDVVQVESLMVTIGAQLRSRQHTDGGWGWMVWDGTSDSMLTAMVGLALDTLNPSKDSPEVRKSIELLLSRQAGDGTWGSESNVTSVRLLASTWVEIYLPTLLDRLGGIDTGVSLTLPANITLSNPNVQPSSMVVQSDGSTVVRWDLVGVTTNGQQLEFDLTLADMQLEESRPAALNARLEFKNSFVDGTVTAPINVPVVISTSNMGVKISTDKSTYNAADVAVFHPVLTNTGTSPRQSQVRMTVLDSVGQVVEVLPLSSPVSTEAGASAGFNQSWSVAGILAGQYTLRADLIGATGAAYASATTTFTVQAGVSQLDSARVVTDKVSYSTADAVRIQSRVGNLSANVLQDDLRVRTTVSAAAGGAPVLQRTENVAQLAPSAFVQYSYSLPGAGLQPGSYLSRVELLDAQGAVLATHVASFTVVGSDVSGVGLAGQLTATPGTALVGQNVSLALQLANNGTAALSNVPVTLRVVDPLSNTVLMTSTQTVASWPVGTTQTLSVLWSAQGQNGQTVVAVATASLAGRDVVLGQANIKLSGQPALRISPTNLSFASVRVGETAATQTVTLDSVGTAAVTSLAVNLAGADAAQFPLSGTCTTLTALPAGQSCTLNISYHPLAVGSHQAQAVVRYAYGADQMVSLAGQAIPVNFTGSLSAVPSQAKVQQPVSLAYTLRHNASVNASGDFKLQLNNGSGQALTSWPFSATVAAGSTWAGNTSYTPTSGPQTLTAVLSQVQGGSSTQVLATTSVVVTKPVSITSTWSASPDARVLVLLSCTQPDANEGYAVDNADDAQRATRAAQAQAKPDVAACVARRTLGIHRLLDELGIAHKIVTSDTAFRQEMRCGIYNTYWISGGAAKLDSALIAELRESVYRGQGLILDGEHDDRNLLLHPIAGVKYRGKLGLTDQKLTFATGSALGTGTLSTLGRPIRLELQGARAQAQFTAGAAPWSAIVTNRYGSGNSAMFAFSLADMVSADGALSNAPLRQLLSAATRQAAAGEVSDSIGDATRKTLKITNLSDYRTPLQVVVTLPVGLSLDSATPAPTARSASDQGSTVEWSLTLEPQASQELGLRVVASQSGNLTVTAQIYSLPEFDGQLRQLLQTQPVVQVVPPASKALADAQTRVQALAPTKANEKNVRTKAINAVTSASTLYSQGAYANAMTQWLAATDALMSITSVDVNAARLAVAQAQESTADALCQSLLCLKGSLSLGVTGSTATSHHDGDDSDHHEDSDKASGHKDSHAASECHHEESEHDKGQDKEDEHDDCVDGNAANKGVLTINRTVSNSCGVSFKSLPLGLDIANRRSALSAYTTSEKLDLTKGQSNSKALSWALNSSATPLVADDWLDVVLSATWQGHLLELGRASTQVPTAQSCPAGQATCH